MPTQGNNIGIYVNLTGTDYDAYVAAVANATEGEQEDTAVVTDYTWTDGDADLERDAGEGNWVLIACATSATINVSNSTNETACKGDVAGALTGNSVRNVSAGNQTWNMSVDGLIDLFDYPAADDVYTGNPADFDTDGEGDDDDYTANQKARAGFVNLMRAAMNRTQLLVAFSTGAGDGEGGTDTSDAVEYVGKAFINSIDATAAVGDFATYSCNFEGNGALNKRYTDTSA